MTQDTGRFRARALAGACALALLAGCAEPLDFDLRGKLGAFSTAPAAQQATASRPKPDARGVISYPTYQVAVARRGDTVQDVAARIGLPAENLAKHNGLSADQSLRDGEVIALPARVPESSGVDIASLAGSAIDASAATTPAAPSVETAALEPVTPKTPEPVQHKVTRGETAYTIARLYQVPVKSLAQWNGLGTDFAIREGQYLLIPVADAAAPKREVPLATVAASEPGQGSPTPTPPSAAKPLPAEKVAALKSPDVETPKPASVGEPTRDTASSAEMGFPVQGKIIRTYAKGRNEGIDIAAKPGSSVKAAADGSVAAITESTDDVPIVVVRHPGNLLTVYANVEGIKVKKGQKVTRGQQLASLRSGDDAYVHFEVRNGFDSVNPLPYLE